MDQIRALIDSGKILNFDACYTDSTIKSITAAMLHKLASQVTDADRANSCRSFFNNAYYRGGISPSVDDRKVAVNAEDWTPERRAQTVATRDDIARNFKTDVGILSSQAGAAALNYPGAPEQVRNAAAELDSLTDRLKRENSRITNYITALQSQQGPEMVNKVEETEFSLRNLEKENKEFKKIADLRAEQAGDLYNKFEGNYHSSLFWYMPLHANSRSALVTTSYFFGFVALILIGIKIASLLMEYSATSLPAGRMNRPKVPTKGPNLSRY
jgi:hypothetical protein